MDGDLLRQCPLLQFQPSPLDTVRTKNVPDILQGIVYITTCLSAVLSLAVSTLEIHC